MILAIECAAACILFAAVVLPSQYKNPLNYIMSYPPEIRKRVESLPQYKNSIRRTENGHIARKLASSLVLVLLLSAVAFLSGAKTFQAAFFHVFLLFLAIDLFDTVILDLCIFCHSQRLRIPGTEDMEKEYQNYWFHIKGGLKGLLLGSVIAFLSAGIV